MKQTEIIEKRKPKEKHYLMEDGSFLVEMYDEDIHFLKDGKFEEIDNTLILKDGYFINKNNDYTASFTSSVNKNIMKIQKQDHFINIRIDKCNDFDIKTKDTDNKLISKISYINVLDNIDISYDIMPSKVKESIIINDKNSQIDKLVFNITTDLTLKLNDDNSISAMFNNETLFNIDAPYMIDSNNQVNKNVYYNLIQDENEYQLQMVLDYNFLNSDIKYPVIIDPTITNSGNDSAVYDTYIYEGDTNVNRNNLDYLKAGVEKVNGKDIINRTLLKFDLPVIGTGSQVINATLNITSYPNPINTYEYNIVDIYRVNTNWTEENANWNTMNDKYDNKVEGTFKCVRTYYVDDNGDINYLSINNSDITSLVQKWYTGTPNYGIMLKSAIEKYKTDTIPMFYSKNRADIKKHKLIPFLAISYRNQNGLESYMNYESHSFTKGSSYHNTYNGNLTSIFNLGSTKSGKMPVTLRLIYNTNDVVLNNNIGYGTGYKLNYNQTIKEVTIDNKVYLEYVDEDGTIHYFLNEKTKLHEDGPVTTETENIFYDEDGLDLQIEKLDSKYVLKDKNNNEMTFTKYNNASYLTTIKDVNGNTNTINYDSEYKKIVSIKDANEQLITINYSANNEIIVTSKDEIVTLKFSNSNILSSIVYNDGTIYIDHDSKYLTSSIKDITGKKISYEYYSESPYKLKKVTEYGLNDTIGNYYDINYAFNSTTITDSKNRAKTITFNSAGNPKSISSLKDTNDITSAYGSQIEYGESYLGDNTIKNKLLSNKIPIKYVKNLLSNTSFESDNINFLTTNGSVVSITDEYPNTGFKSLKFNSSKENSYIYKFIDVTKEKYYTFSAYVKQGNSKVKLSIRYKDENDNIIEEFSDVTTNEEFERLDVTIFYKDTSKSNLELRIYSEKTGTCYIDDIQLEEGEVVNNYNLIENSDFSNGLTDWIFNCYGNYSVSDVFSVVDIEGQKALKVNMFTSNESSMERHFNITGKKYDHYTLSFWYKNKGLTGATNLFQEGTKNNVSIIFYPVDESIATDAGIEDFILNPNEDEWQFFVQDFYSHYDFKSFNLSFYQMLNGNELYITNINLFKDVRSVTYSYDDDGNLISSKNLNDKTNKFNYDKNNELIKMTDAKGKIFNYEYDNIVSDRVLKGISETGISNEIEYDSFGNPIISRIIDRGNMLKPSDGIYKIRLKGTNNCFSIVNDGLSINEDTHGHNKWNIEKIVVDSKDYYKISHTIINDKYLTITDNNVVLLSYKADNSLFELIKQDNGSYYIKSKSTDKYIKNNDNNLVLFDLIENDYNFEFYFESNTNSKFIENSAEYTEDGMYITKTIDTNLNEINYDIDTTTGLINSITNPNNITTYYNYNELKQLKSIVNNDRVVNYEYNSNNTLSKITQDSRIYKFNYDSFLNIKSINIGDNITLITNTYEDNNGNLIKTTYGNNQVINYEYDEFDRIKKLIKNDNTYNYKYNNNGDLVKIISNSGVIKYTYDLAKRLYEYSNNDFKIRYGYDSNDNIISKKYRLNDIDHTITNTLNEDDMLIKTTIDTDEINHNYDNLGRLINSNINNNYQTNYEYVNNGNRTSMLVKSISNNNDKYSYNYDKLGNITHIYHNDVLENRYYYDDYNELIKDDNYITNKTTIYEYDNLGNILYEKVYDVGTNNELYQNKYEYNNVKWKDQLTKFNDDIITYDNLGNPLTIGNDITLTWINGRQLNSYIDQNNTINYKYNIDGIRTNKIINNVETKYYLEGSKIILEVNSDNVLYYIRSNLNGLIGFRYNNDVYYYIKNSEDDIIGILDSHYDVVTKYTYDSWGNILTITDGNGQDVSNNSNHIANINPYRYRSYYYDKETKLYYLNSRYYNPRWGRFINLDGIISSGDTIKGNLYSYCNNDPINNVDSNGQSFLKSAWNFLKETGKNILKPVIDTAKMAITKLFQDAGKYLKTDTRSVIDSSSKTIRGVDQVFKISEQKSELLIVTKGGNRNSSGSLNMNCDGVNSTIELSSDFSHTSISLENGIGKSNFSVINKNNGDTFSVGTDNLDIYFQWGHTGESGDSITGEYFRVEVNQIILAATVVCLAYAPAPSLSVLKDIIISSIRSILPSYVCA